MKKSNLFLTLGLLLLVCAFVFIWCAVSGYLGMGSLPVAVLYLIYGVYIAVTGGLLLLSVHHQRKNEGRISVPKMVLTVIGLCLTGLLAFFLAYLVVFYISISFF